jgi:hypothetical protein
VGRRGCIDGEEILLFIIPTYNFAVALIRFNRRFRYDIDETETILDTIRINTYIFLKIIFGTFQVKPPKGVTMDLRISNNFFPRILLLN